MQVLELTLRKTVLEDLAYFFEFQLDEEANFMAAFTAKDPTNRQAYIDKYTVHALNPEINMKTIILNDEIVGSIAKFTMNNNAEITYWISRKYWNKGVATQALTLFLESELTRPIFARTAFDNLGSQCVLEKCGFKKIGTDKGFANARNAEVEEFIFNLT